MEYEITKGKGKKGQNCNVTHCQKPLSAHHNNTAMYAYYCIDCATKIEKSARSNGMTFFPSLANHCLD